MYAKLFSSILSSSLWTEDDPTRILFITMLALADRNGFVYGSPAGLARMACLSKESCYSSLDKLMSGDPDSTDLSRNPDGEGKRIEALESGGWRIVNYEYYRDLKDDDTRRAQYRESKRKSRSTSVNSGPHLSTSVHIGPPSSTPSTLRSDQLRSDQLNSDQKYISHTETGRPPTAIPEGLDEVRYLWSEWGLNGTPEDFFDHFEANGWRVGGKTPMKDWWAAARQWSRRAPEFQGRTTKTLVPPANFIDFDKGDPE